METLVTRKGQTTIPLALRQRLGIKPGSRIQWEAGQGCLRLRLKAGGHSIVDEMTQGGPLPGSTTAILRETRA